MSLFTLRVVARFCQLHQKKKKNHPTPKTTKNLLPAGSSELESGMTPWLFPPSLFTIYMHAWLSVAWWKILSPRPAPRNPSVCTQGPMAVVGPSCLATPSRQWGLIAKPPSNRVFCLFPPFPVAGVAGEPAQPWSWQSGCHGWLWRVGGMVSTTQVRRRGPWRAMLGLAECCALRWTMAAAGAELPFLLVVEV